MAESKSTSEQSTVPDPFQSISSDGYQYESQPKDWWMFPEGAIDPYLQDWYSKHLVAAKESKIYPDLKRTHYRFTWLRTFHHPFIFHVMQDGNGDYTLTTTMLSGKGGYEPGEISFTRQTLITEVQLLELQNRLKKIEFWELPTDEHDDNGMDGARWILECVDSNYHVVDRWNAGVLSEVGKWFMETGEIDIPEHEIY